jgi:predicted ATPase
VDRAEGNPLFAEELSRALFRHLDNHRHAAGATSTLGEPSPELPPTIGDILLERIDVLRPELKAVLQMAAVIGREFSRPLLATVAPGGVDLDDALLRLEMLGLVRLTRLAPVRTYRFEQVLTREAIYQALPDDARAHLHELISQAADSLGEPQPTGLIESTG